MFVTFYVFMSFCRKRARLDLKAKKSEELNKLTIWRGARRNYVVLGPGRAGLAEDTDYLARAQEGQNQVQGAPVVRNNC